MGFCDFNDDGATIRDTAISRADVSRRLTRRFNRFCENDTDEAAEREEGKEERSASSRLLRRRVAVYRGTRAHRVSSRPARSDGHGGAFIRGKSEV